MSSGTAEGAVAPAGRRLRRGQRAELVLLDVGEGSRTVLHTATERLIEAPNWHPDGRTIVVNADGRLFRLVVEAPGELRGVETVGLLPVNNDHLVSPDGSSHLVSARDGHIHRVPWHGGRARRLTSDKAPERRFRHFLHGVTPDGETLAYVGTEALDGDEWGRRALWLLDLRTGTEEMVGDGFSPADGPEFSPDGRFLYFNSECRSSTAGHSQVFRYGLADGSLEQLTADERVNWFPHPSPDATSLVYLSYPPGTEGHPADRSVELRRLAPSGARTLLELPGGQGTINVNSWSPDSRFVAFVAYPFDEEERCT